MFVGVVFVEFVVLLVFFSLCFVVFFDLGIVFLDGGEGKVCGGLMLWEILSWFVV